MEQNILALPEGSDYMKINVKSVATVNYREMVQEKGRRMQYSTLNTTRSQLLPCRFTFY